MGIKISPTGIGSGSVTSLCHSVCKKQSNISVALHSFVSKNFLFIQQKSLYQIFFLCKGQLGQGQEPKNPKVKLSQPFDKVLV